ncbi:MAG: amidohydrolase family protein, partial [Chloroflexi bacterium]|nr:amidohydrolase family protein [Chloroflexota bacterium]
MTRVPDLVVTGRIATLAGDRGFGWVDAIAVGAGRVLAAGGRTEVESLAGPRTRRLDLATDVVAIPGLVDAHLHLADAALAAGQVELEGTVSLEGVLDRIAAGAARAGANDDWLQGAGWDPAAWGRWPTALDLERVAPGRLVALWSHDRHALWVSTRALTEAGIDRSTLDPPGGSIRRDSAGRPTGVLQESAARAVLERIAASADLSTAIGAYSRQLLRLGLVGVHDPGRLIGGQALTAIEAVIELDDRGALPIRVHASVREPALEAAIERGWRTGAPIGGGPVDRARMGWLKLFADGALGSRTALLAEPYAGSTKERGLAVTSEAVLADVAGRAAAAGIVPEIHAIGDEALRVVLGVLEGLTGAISRTGPMLRVEHVQLARADDLPRFARSRIAASIQPIHLRTDRDKAEAAWGRERAGRDAFRVRSLLAAGAVVAFGTDAPVEP